MGRSHARALLALGVAALAGCGRDATDSTSDAPRPDVVVIVLDTARQDGLPIYGYGEVEMPTLDRLAAGGHVFTNAWTTSSWTAPATASILSGLYPQQHGVELGFLASLEQSEARTAVTMAHLPDGLEILPEALAAAGYETYGIADNLNVSAELGLTDGFDVFVNTHREAIDAGGTAYAGIERVAELVEQMAPDFQAAQPGFFYLHLMDPHGPYGERAPWYDVAPDADLLTKGRGRYDSELAYLDHHLARILELLGTGDDALVVVVSDHGEEFLDHGGLDHGFQLHAELTRACLVVRPPGAIAGPRRDERLASVVDVLPTLRAALGLPDDGRLAGRDLLGQPADEERAVFARRRAGLEPEADMIHAIVAESRHWIGDNSGQRPRLYDTATDPREQRDLFAEQAELAERLRGRLTAFEAQAPPEPHERVLVDLDAGTIASLAHLGYVDEE